MQYTYQIAPKEWQRGIFSCTASPLGCSGCCYVMCCPCCAFCDVAEWTGDSKFLCCCFGECCCVAAILRGNLRKTLGIEGNCALDCLCAFCCPLCSLCQELNEIKVRTGEQVPNLYGIHKGRTYDAEEIKQHIQSTQLGGVHMMHQGYVPPQHQGYAPQHTQQGYSPQQQQGYMPVGSAPQQGYPPQQQGYPPQQQGYPQQQQGYSPQQQQGYPPQQQAQEQHIASPHVQQKQEYPAPHSHHQQGGTPAPQQVASHDQQGIDDGAKSPADPQ